MKSLLSYEEFENEIRQFYNENNIYVDDNRISLINTRFKFAVPSMAYMFTPGIGRYEDRTLEISPSDDHPYLITITREEKNKNKKLLSKLNPSTRIQTMSSDSDFDYLIMRLELKKNIGQPSILIYPKGSGKLGKLFGKQEIPINPIEEKYKIKRTEHQYWFKKCLDSEISGLLYKLNLPKNKGAVFQFSNNSATFSILPRSIGKTELNITLRILAKFAKNIDVNFQ